MGTVALLGGGGPPAYTGNSNDLDLVVQTLSKFLTTLGIPHTLNSLHEALRRGFGGGSGGGGGGGGWGGGFDGGDYARSIVDFLLGHVRNGPCVPCVTACSSNVKYRINKYDAAEAAKKLTRLVDRMLRKYKKISLVRYVHNKLVEYVDDVFRTRQAPIVKYGLRYVGLKRLLLAGQLVQRNFVDIDLARYGFASIKVNPVAAVRLLTLKYIFNEYVDYYIPAWTKLQIKYDKKLNSELFSSGKYTAAINGFLTGKDADLAPVIGVFVEHLMDVTNHVDARVPNAGCVLCENLPISCTSKAAKVVTDAAKKSATGALKRVFGMG